MTKTELTSFVCTVCYQYRRNMPIVNAVRHATDETNMTAAQASRIRNAAIKELKSLGDWDYNRPEVWCNEY